jgi:hypothetical protein
MRGLRRDVPTPSLRRYDDLLLSRTLELLGGSDGEWRCATVGSSNDAPEVDRVQRPKSFLTQRELVL